jgi:enoyl-CoA hydratase
MESSGPITVVTVDRPKALNALNQQVLQDLATVIDQILVNKPRCVILTGAGEKAFVAGADIASMSEMARPQARALAELGQGVFRRWEQLPMPTIAAINGFALGGGCELALSCDIRLASAKARFGQPEVGLGIIPGFGGTQRLARTIGVGLAKELIFGGQMINAERALAIGLVNSVYEPDELMAAAQKLAGKIAAQAPIAVRAAKEAMALGVQTDIDSGMTIEAAYFATCFETEDQREGMAAFVEKRPEPVVFQDA